MTSSDAAPRLKALLLDLGGVVFNLGFTRPALAMARRCANGRFAGLRALMSAFYNDPILRDYETGRVSGAEFVRHFSAKLKFGGSDEDFIWLWRAVVDANPAMFAFVREAARRVPVYYFSNVGSLHVPYIFETWPEAAVHAGAAFSFEMGIMKPAEEFYRRALAMFRLKAGECLFVDDSPANVEGARACGIPSMVFVSPSASLPELKRHLGW